MTKKKFFPWFSRILLVNNGHLKTPIGDRNEHRIVTRMNIQFTVRQGDPLPYVESFQILSQDEPCPPHLITTLVHQIHVELAHDPSRREFAFPFRTCPCQVTLQMKEGD